MKWNERRGDEMKWKEKKRSSPAAGNAEKHSWKRGQRGCKDSRGARKGTGGTRGWPVEWSLLKTTTTSYLAFRPPPMAKPLTRELAFLGKEGLSKESESCAGSWTSKRTGVCREGRGPDRGWEKGSHPSYWRVRHRTSAFWPPEAKGRQHDRVATRGSVQVGGGRRKGKPLVQEPAEKTSAFNLQRNPWNTSAHLAEDARPPRKPGCSSSAPPTPSGTSFLWLHRPRSPVPPRPFRRLSKKAHLTKVHKPTYQEYMMGFIIPGQEDIPSQHVAFQTVATVKVGGITPLTSMFPYDKTCFSKLSKVRPTLAL